jgi:MlaD protein
VTFLQRLRQEVEPVKKTVLVVAVVAVAIFAAWLIRGEYHRRNTVYVVFPHSEGISVGAGVWMAGVNVGRVLNVGIVPEGAELVLFLSGEARAGLTTKAIFFLDAADRNLGPLVRVKDVAKNGQPLQYGARLAGTNLQAIWQMSELSEKIQGLANDPQLKGAMQMLLDLGNQGKGK